MRISRREFVKSVTASGIALSMSRLAMARQSTSPARETCRVGKTGIRRPPEAGASTVSSRSPGRNSTRAIFAPPISPAGREDLPRHAHPRD